MKFSELQNLLEKNLGIEHLADIARELGVSPQAVSNWKSRDKVPYKYVVKIRKSLIKPDVDHVSKNNYARNNTELTEYNYDNYYDEETISIADLFLIIARQLKIILIIPSIFCLYTLIHVFLIAKPVYQSPAKIMSSSSGASSQASAIASRFGIDLPDLGGGQTWVYPEIVKSRTLARSMIKRKFDTIKFGTQKALLHILSYKSNYMKLNINMIEKTAIDKFIGMINFKKSGSFYELSISAPEAVLARDLTIAMIEELESNQRNNKKEKTSETRKFIEKLIAENRVKLEQAEENLKDFTVRNRRMENSPALQLDRQRLSREVSVMIGVFTTLKQQLETLKIEEVKESDYITVLDPPETPLQPSSPNRKRSLIFAGIFGIIIGVIIGFIRDFLQNSDHNSKEKVYQIKELVISNFSLSRFIKK